jgi:hypothetical protein
MTTTLGDATDADGVVHRPDRDELPGDGVVLSNADLTPERGTRSIVPCSSERRSQPSQ